MCYALDGDTPQYIIPQLLLARYQFEYDDLERKLRKGRTKAECQKSDELVLIKHILREVNPFSFEQIKDAYSQRTGERRAQFTEGSLR